MKTYLSSLALVSAFLISGSLLKGDIDIFLYDDSINQLPHDQAWLSYADNTFFTSGTVTSVATGTGVTLTSDAVSSAGYSSHTFLGNLKNGAFPALDATNGYTLSFQLQIFNEAHVSNDRAGFSVIALSSDNTGIEIGFWADKIWAQSDTPLFQHAEEVDFDTTTTEITYELSIVGTTYSLSADGVEKLTGSTRNYSSFGSPYSIPNYIFLGDNTSSASAGIGLGDVNLTVVPEPSQVAVLFGGIALLALVFRRRNA